MPFHLLGGMPDIGVDLGRQLLIANDQALVYSSAVVAEEAEGSWVQRVFPRLDHFLSYQGGPEAEAAAGVLESPRRKVVDVLGIEFLERCVEIVVVAGSVRSLEIQCSPLAQEDGGPR